MDLGEGTLFLRGISVNTSEDNLRDYFAKYGEITNTKIMRHQNTNDPRNFGFVDFANPSILHKVLQDRHYINGKMVEVKRGLSREEETQNFFRTKTIFVGGLPTDLTKDEFREYFQSFGHVTDLAIICKRRTKQPRGFGFVTFDTEDAVDRVLHHTTFHHLKGRFVEVKRNVPQDSNPPAGRGGSGYEQQAYGYGGNASPLLYGQMDYRFVQPQSTVWGGQPYYSFGVPICYVYGSYGTGYGVSGYGSGNIGFGGPPLGARTYGNPNIGYVSDPRSSSQTPGYGGGYYWSAYGSGNGNSGFSNAQQ